MVNEEHSGLKKLFSALITPMDSHENVNYSALKQVVEWQLKSGVEGFYCCGSSGEGLLLSLEERKKVLECVLSAVDGRVPVISHIGTIRTQDVIALAKHAKDAGAAAVSMIPPYYYKFSMDEITAYYEDVLHAVPEVGAIIYNIPQFTGIEFSKDNAARLLDNPAVIGIKHTSNNLYAMERMGSAYPEKLIFNGFDEQYLGALSMGSHATIGTTVNLFAPMFLKIRDLFSQGRMQAAHAVQTQLNLRVELMVKEGIFNAVKYGFSLQGIDCGTCRAPFKALTQESKRLLKEVFDEPT